MILIIFIIDDLNRIFKLFFEINFLFTIYDF